MKKLMLLAAMAVGVGSLALSSTAKADHRGYGYGYGRSHGCDHGPYNYSRYRNPPRAYRGGVYGPYGHGIYTPGYVPVYNNSPYLYGPSFGLSTPSFGLFIR